MNYVNEMRVEFSPLGLQQVNSSTVVPAVSLNTSLRADVKTFRAYFSRKEFMDCSNQFLESQRVLSRYVEVTFEFDTDVKMASLWSAFAIGSDGATGTNPITHQMNMLVGRQLPVTTLRIGHDDGVDVGWIISNVAVDSISFSGASGDDSTLRCAVTCVGSGALVAGASASWAPCYANSIVTLFDPAKSLVIDTVDYFAGSIGVHGTRFTYSNNIPRAAAFVGGQQDVVRWLRGRVRGYEFSAQIEGIDAPANALATKCRLNDGAGKQVTDTLWRFGTATATDSYSCKIPNGYLSFAEQPQDYLGADLGEIAVLNVVVKATKPAGSVLVTEPFNVTALLASSVQSQAFLLTS